MRVLLKTVLHVIYLQGYSHSCKLFMKNEDDCIIHHYQIAMLLIKIKVTIILYHDIFSNFVYSVNGTLRQSSFECFTVQ